MLTLLLKVGTEVLSLQSLAVLFQYFTAQQVVSTTYLQNSSVIRAPGRNRADRSASLFPSAGFKATHPMFKAYLQGKRTSPHQFC